MEDPEEPMEALARIRGALGDVPNTVLDQMVQQAMRVGARRLLDVLDAEGRIEPCGEGCGWEGPWQIDSTLWPADRERLLGAGYVPPAQAAETEERRRLLSLERHRS